MKVKFGAPCPSYILYCKCYLSYTNVKIKVASKAFHTMEVKPNKNVSYHEKTAPLFMSCSGHANRASLLGPSTLAMELSHNLTK
jgi:hypothetical protein